MGARSHGRAIRVTDTALRERLAILVHEVRSPVAALSAISEAFTGPQLERAARRSLVGLAVEACRGIERVVADASASSVTPARVDLGRIVLATVEAAQLRGVDARAELESGLPVVPADPVRIRQALENLVTNAVAHAGPDVRVVIGARATTGAVALTVSDDGLGIPEEDQERIFETGVRLEGAGPGFGLGLALVRAIAHAHDATVRLESAPGQGATFTISLPRAT